MAKGAMDKEAMIKEVMKVTHAQLLEILLFRMLESKPGEERCILLELGWSAGSDEQNLATLTQDLMNLPGNMSAEILSSATECTSMKVEKWSKKMER